VTTLPVMKEPASEMSSSIGALLSSR